MRIRIRSTGFTHDPVLASHCNIYLFLEREREKGGDIVSGSAEVAAGGTKIRWLQKSGPLRLQCFLYGRTISSLGRYVFGSEISYNKAPPRLPGLGC